MPLTTAFSYIISNYFDYFSALKDCFNKHDCNFDMSEKMATAGLHKINVF